jgi:hypothetical protein
LRTLIPIDRGQRSDDPGQVVRSTAFKGSLRGVGVKRGALSGFFRWFAQGLAVERNAVRSMPETVEDGVSNLSILSLASRRRPGAATISAPHLRLNQVDPAERARPLLR